MSNNRNYYIGPVTGHRYDLAAGEKIDPVAEGIGVTGEKRSPKAEVDGREKYRRIFIRLRTPEETLTCRPIEDGEDFARRVAIIEQWYDTHVPGRNVLLEFTAREVAADELSELGC